MQRTSLTHLGARGVKQGGEVSFTATGFPAGGTPSVKFDDKTLLRQFTVGDDGSVSGSGSVPADASVGGGPGHGRPSCPRSSRRRTRVRPQEPSALRAAGQAWIC